MNLSKLFPIQKQLDARIEEEHGLQGQDLLDKKILALQVELGELANEWRGFKFWSINQDPRITDNCSKCGGDGNYPFYGNGCSSCGGDGLGPGNPLLEEYVDCLHFILSIGLEKGFDNINYESLYKQSIELGVTFKDKNITIQFINVFYFTSQFENEISAESYEDLVLCFIALGKELGFTTEQIEQAYLDKNKINHERQEAGY
ncbi:Dimeric dUTPase, all-alpha-NTP-PPase (MazG) superfamily [Virgibacillus subterraneus]|uniref:Dimeric dUTPase, all-alpha-NTP-PPase (MazG) superfamily n=1 Tax=Virgibacillus subterraneus TaxID=621109 RepID=A0A1H8YZ89_9BACI|nr:dUTP diphosphatase [Virgibacillus subterraneus]SEP57391.1 Dimeric dUTPase, all-alpha-NTP-PPase (MazG) superfamily [Virgibacillus subterraneus]